MSRKPAPDGLTTYTAALCLIEYLDGHLERGTRHYRTLDGKLLTELDEIVRAVLLDELATGEKQCQTKITSSTPC